MYFGNLQGVCVKVLLIFFSLWIHKKHFKILNLIKYHYLFILPQHISLCSFSYNGLLTAVYYLILKFEMSGCLNFIV